jgi:hypothetical protein
MRFCAKSTLASVLLGALLFSACDDAPPQPPGRFRPARTAAPVAEPDADQQAMIEQLEAIGYLSGTQAARASGVTIHDRERAQPGLNFYSSGHMQGALLMDMDGNVVHEWKRPFPADVGRDERRKFRKGANWWRRAYLMPDGDVIAIVTGAGLLRVDKDSNLLWARPLPSHHDLAFEPDGDIWLLTRTVHMVPRIHPNRPTVEDTLTLLDPEGHEKRTFSLLEAFEKSDFADVIKRSRRTKGDIFHTNSVERLDGRAEAAHLAFREGNLLLSFRHLDAIAIVDPEQEKVVWGHTGEYKIQHDPKIVGNGRMLLFDNRTEPGRSAVLEFDPATMDKTWEFRGSDAKPFYSNTCGTAERLANGNTLITESDYGRAFEVTPGGRIVWEFYLPYHAGEDDRFIASLPELIRLPEDFPTDWLEGDREDQLRFRDVR